MTADTSLPFAPWRRDFNAARDPQTARIALGIAASSGGVLSINTLSGALTIAAGTGINVASAGTTITISAPIFGTSAQGEVPASGGGTVNFLRADGTWAAPPAPPSGLTVGTTTISGGTTGRFLYDNAGVLGEYTGTQATAQLDLFSSTLKGLAPSSGGGTTNYLRADGTWAAPSAGAGITTCTVTRYTSGSGTHTPGGSTKIMRVRLLGGGGGGGAGGTVSVAATAGGNTTFGALTAGGGAAGPSAGGGNGGAGGAASGGNVLNNTGNAGGPFIYLSAVGNAIGGSGGGNPFGGGGTTGGLYGSGSSAATNSGAGGGGGGATSSVNGGSGGGSGGCVEHLYTSLAGSYSYAVGAGGSNGTGTTNGGVGGPGLIVIEEYS